MEFTFTNEYKRSRLDEVVEYLTGPRLWIPDDDYPDFFDWMEKTWKELEKSRKRAMVAFHGNEIAGVTIYQKHKKDRNALEIKNLTVRPDKRGRYVASFLLRNTEIEGRREFGSRYAVGDAKAKNLAIRFFMTKHRYKIIGKHDLYGLKSGKDLIYKKELTHIKQP